MKWNIKIDNNVSPVHTSCTLPDCCRRRLDFISQRMIYDYGERAEEAEREKENEIFFSRPRNTAVQRPNQ